MTTDMTTEKLRSYRANRAELEEIALELAKCEVGIAVQSAADAPYSKHTATQSGLPPTPSINYPPRASKPSEGITVRNRTIRRRH